MANSNESGLGPREFARGADRDARDATAGARAGASTDRDRQARQPDGSDSTGDDAPRGDPRDRETPAAREAREKREEAERVEAEFKRVSETPLDFEELAGIDASPLARHAIARFDPRDRRPQLAEHWQYNDAEIHEHGYF